MKDHVLVLVHAREVQDQVNHSTSIDSVGIFLELSSNVFVAFENLFIRIKLSRRMGQGSGTKIQWTGHDGGTQTQIHPSTGYDNRREVEKKGAGEVRVIVQPIQPVFYMPQPSKKIVEHILSFIHGFFPQP